MYEIPSELKGLYRHWEKHTIPKEEKSSHALGLDMDVLHEIRFFARERMHIWHKRYQNKERPYTKDQILRDYRFCNIYRELDRQTIEIHTHLKSFCDDLDTWLLNLFFFRFVCDPRTVRDVDMLSYEKDNNEKVYERLLKKKKPKYGSAYVFPISVIQKSEYSTRESFFCLYLPEIMKQVSDEIRDFDNVSVAEAVERVVAVLGFNFTFHTTEVLIDVAYQYPEYIDLFSRFPIGPGSKPTMKLLSKENPEDTCLLLTQYRIQDFPYLTYNKRPVLLSTENWEGIGCEFRKYANLKNGSGRKRRYRSIDK